MANDPTPTTDQQVANRPGQTAPVPLPAGLQPDTATGPSAFSGWDNLVAKQGQEPAGWKNLVTAGNTVNMLTPEGSNTGDVPLPNVQKAREAGYHIAIPMKSPEDQKGWVPYHRVADALASGFKHASDKLGTAGDELANLTSAGLLPAFLKTPKGKEINDQFNQEIQGIIHNPQKRASFLVGLVQPGGEGAEELLPELGQKVPKPTVGGEPARVPPEKTTGQFDAAIKAGGAVPGGVQKGDPEIDLKDIVMFHDPATGSTLGLNPEDVSPENVRAQMRTSRAAYLKAKPEESQIVPPGHPLHIPDEPVKAATVAEGADAFNIKPIAKAIEAHSAGAVDPKTGQPEPAGQGLHGLEILPEARQRFANRPTEQDITAFSQRNAALFGQHPELRLGWDHDPKNHPDQPWELNVGASGTPEGAARVGKRLDQRAAYNIDKGEDVPLGGKNQQTEFADYPLEERLADLKASAAKAAEPAKGIAKLDQPLEADYANAKPIEYPWGADFNNRTAAGMVFPDGRITNARMAHMDIAHAAGYNDPEAPDNLTDFLKDSGAVRVIYPEFGEGNIGLELHKPPTDDQMRIVADNLKRATNSGVGDGSVTWDLALPNGKYQSGTGSIEDFQRAVDKWKEPETPQAIPKDLGKATTQTIVKGSTVNLRENPLEVKPTGESSDKPSTADVALALAKFTRKQLPMLEYGKAKPETQIARAKSIAEDEAKYQLAQNNTGEHWYTKDMAAHDKTAIDMRPELADPNKLSLFKFVEGVLSSGQKPYANFKSAMRAWDHYSETDEFPVVNPDTGRSWGPRGERAYGSAIDSINRLIQEKGEQGAAEWLQTDHPVKELHSYMTPTQTRVAGKADDLQPGAMILGPKRGPFALNLHGKETPFTADMWVSRIWHRWMGTTEVGPDGEVTTDSPRSNKERSLMRQSFDETAQKLGISTSSLQAVLWYYEQALYHVHGAAKESWNFADAAKRVSDEEFSNLNFEEPEAPVKGKKK